MQGLVVGYDAMNGTPCKRCRQEFGVVDGKGVGFPLEVTIQEFGLPMTCVCLRVSCGKVTEPCFWTIRLELPIYQKSVSYES